LKTTLENIYDFYCPYLYSVALQISPTTQQAEELLIMTFQKAHTQHVDWVEQGKSFCFLLIKLMVQIAQEQLSPGETKCNFKISQFEKTPLLHQLLVEQHSIDSYCIANDVGRHQVVLQIRDEFRLFRV